MAFQPRIVRADIYDLLSWANRVREHFKGNKIHLCSIVNAKAGACSENCSFCAQSSFYQTGSPKYGFVDPEPVFEAADEANKNGVTAVGLVAAWKGLNEGPMLDEVCDRIRELKTSGKTRPDASLGIIKNQKVADRLKEAGLECYGHNLESSRRFFPTTCTTHTFDDRLQTIGYLKKAGIKICSGGIIGMGETREDRCDLAFTLKEIGANVVPVNILNPIPGTPFEKLAPLPPMEILKTIACFRMILPRQEIMVAGGRTINLRDMQSMVFMAGASALMVGNYLTTLGISRWKKICRCSKTSAPGPELGQSRVYGSRKRAVVDAGKKSASRSQRCKQLLNRFAGRNVGIISPQPGGITQN